MAIPSPTALPARDAAWHDAQYNNRALVPDSGALLARWPQWAAEARAALGGDLDVAYGDAPSERLDVFRPRQAPGSAPAPLLFFIHGGYWRALDKADHSFIAPAYVDAGAVVVVPNYALAPAVTIETIACQMTRALAWTWRNAARLGADRSRIVVAGHSAGGHLAAMLLACRWKAVGDDLPLRLVAGALSLSGLFDLEPIRQTPFLQGDLKLTPASVRRLSPAFFPRPRGPLVTLVGADESDEFRRQNRLIRDQWGPSTVPVCEEVPGCNHFTVLQNFAEPQGRAFGHARALLGL